MADEIIVETTSTQVIEVSSPGPQGPAGAAGSGLETLTTRGDTLYRGNTTGERLPIGTTGQILRVSSSGLPEWGAAPASGVSSVSGKTGAVTLNSTDISSEQALEVYEAGTADCNGFFIYGGLFNGRPTYYATKDTFIYWDGSNWVINHNGEDQYFGSSAIRPWDSVWSLGQGANPLPVVDKVTSREFEQIVGQRTNPTALGNAAGKNVGSGANDVAAGNHTHAAATQSVAGFLSAADKTKLDGIAAGAEVNVNADWNATSGDAQILNKPSTFAPSAHAASHTAGTKAQYSGQVAGMTENVFIRANNIGTAGNSITLNFDGADDIDTVIAAWNSANPSNQATLTSGDGAQIPDSGETIALLGGVASGSDPITSANLSSLLVSGSDELNPDIVFKGRAFLGNASGSTGFITDSNAPFHPAETFGFTGVNEAVTQYRPVGFTTGYFAQLFLDTSGDIGVGTSSPEAKLDVNGNAILRDVTNNFKATFVADDKLSADRTYDLPDRSGELMIVGDAPSSHAHGNLTNDGKIGSTAGLPVVTTTAGAVTTLALGTSGQVLTVNSGATGVEFAAASGGVSAVNSTLADILSVSGSDLVADDLGADKLYGWDDSASKAIGFTIGSGLSVSGDTLSATASGGSKTYAVFSAEHNQPPSTAFATLDTRNSIAVLDFDAATDENAVFVGIMPEAASLGSGLIVRLHWMATTATSGNVRWGVQFERSNTDLDADSFAAAVEANGAANGTSGIITTTAITVTDFDGITAGDVFRLKVFRNADDATNDTMTGDAELVAVELRSAA